MCIDDFRIGRLIRTVFTAYDLVAVSPVILQANQQRVGFSIWNNSGSSSLLPQFVLSIGGITLGGTGTNQRHVHFTLAEYGDLVTRQITISAGTFGAAGGIAEYFLPEEYLAAALEQFRSQYGLRKL